MRSVLLIDDDAVSRELFALLLETEGYAVRACENGDAALTLLRSGRWKFYAILSDMQMPGITGAALAEAIRALSPDIILIGMSASEPAGGLPPGFDAFLRKPFNGAQFTQTLNSRASAAITASAQENSALPDLDQAIAAPLIAAMPPEQLSQLYSLALNDTRKRADAMRRSLAGGDDAAFRKEAHAIKGSAAMLGARALADIARKMEETGIAGDASRLLDDLVAAAGRLEGILVQGFPTDQASHSSMEKP